MTKLRDDIREILRGHNTPDSIFNKLTTDQATDAILARVRQELPEKRNDDHIPSEWLLGYNIALEEIEGRLK
jgi:hypothetical protein